MGDLIYTAGQYIADFLVLINPSVTYTVSLFELSALLFSISAGMFIYFGLGQAHHSLNTLLSQRKNGALLMIAKENLRVARSRKILIMVAFGLALLGSVAPSTTIGNYRWVNTVYGILIVCLSAQVTLSSWYSLRFNKKLDDKVEELQRQEELMAIRGGRRATDLNLGSQLHVIPEDETENEEENDGT